MAKDKYPSIFSRQMKAIVYLFTPKPRILRLILNSRPVFKNQLYFMVAKYNFVAFFQDTFSACGITQNHLRLRFVISGNSLLSKDINYKFGAFNYSTKSSRSISGKSLPLQTIELSNRVSNPKFEANLSA